MSSKPEPAIWSRDTSQRIFWYDSCQLNIVCMSNIKDTCCNPRLHDLVLAGWPPCCATSFAVVVVGRTRPWSMPLAILTIRKELHGFLFLCIRVVPFSIIMGLRLAVLRAARAPLLGALTRRIAHLRHHGIDGTSRCLALSQEGGGRWKPFRWYSTSEFERVFTDVNRTLS